MLHQSESKYIFNTALLLHMFLVLAKRKADIRYDDMVEEIKQ